MYTYVCVHEAASACVPGPSIQLCVTLLIAHSELPLIHVTLETGQLERTVHGFGVQYLCRSNPELWVHENQHVRCNGATPTAQASD